MNTDIEKVKTILERITKKNQADYNKERYYINSLATHLKENEITSVLQTLTKNPHSNKPLSYDYTLLYEKGEYILLRYKL